MKTKFVARLLVYLALTAGFATCVTAAEPWIIDTHTHFKGAEQVALEAKTTKRAPQNTLGQVKTPDDYRPLADRLKIQATVIVEAVEQEHPQHNDWVLAQAKSNLVCGYIARGDLASADFLTNYERYLKSGYLRGYRFRMNELRGYLKSDVARANLKRLEKDGMVVDLLIGSEYASDVITLAKDYPKMTIVIDHCFRFRLVEGKISPEWKAAVESCGKLPNVHIKLSSILNFVGSQPFAEPAPTDLKIYAPVLQACFDAFGEDRVVFATNWAVCTHYGKVDDVVRIVAEFLKSQSETALRKGMRDNAIRIFKIRTEDLR